MSDTPETVDATVDTPVEAAPEHWTDAVERHLAEDFGAAIRVLKDVIHRIEQKLEG